MKKKVRDLTEKELQSICDKQQFDCKDCPLAEFDFWGEYNVCAIEIMNKEVEIDE